MFVLFEPEPLSFMNTMSTRGFKGTPNGFPCDLAWFNATFLVAFVLIVCRYCLMNCLDCYCLISVDVVVFIIIIVVVDVVFLSGKLWCWERLAGVGVCLGTPTHAWCASRPNSFSCLCWLRTDYCFVVVAVIIHMMLVALFWDGRK